MYRIFNFLFGWDYIYWSNTADQGIARIYSAQDYKVFYFRCKITRLIDLVSDPKEVEWLTCNSSKYFKDLR